LSTDGTCISGLFSAARRVRADMSWRRALGLAVNSREAALKEGVY
jgi:hypothetical protein